MAAPRYTAIRITALVIEALQNRQTVVDTPKLYFLNFLGILDVKVATFSSHVV